MDDMCLMVGAFTLQPLHADMLLGGQAMLNMVC